MKTKSQLLVFWLTIGLAVIYTFILSEITGTIHSSIMVVPLLLLSMNTGSEVIRDFLKGWLFLISVGIWVMIVAISMVFYQFYWNSPHILFIVILILNNYTNIFHFQFKQGAV